MKQVLFLSVLLLAVPACAGTTQIPFDTSLVPDKDGAIYSAAAGLAINYGKRDTIRVGSVSGDVAYLLQHFDFTWLPHSVDTPVVITTALDSIYFSSVNGAPALSAWQIGDDWLEGTKTGATTDSTGCCWNWNGWSNGLLDCLSVCGQKLSKSDSAWAARKLSTPYDTITVSTTGWKVFDNIVPLVQALVDSAKAKAWGIAIAPAAGSGSSNANVRTREFAGYEPRLYIEGYYVITTSAEAPTDFTIDTTECEVAVLTWTDPIACDSIIILRNGLPIDTVACGVETYSDSARGYGISRIGWSLIGMDGGYTDTTEQLYGTIARCVPVNYCADPYCEGCYRMSGASQGLEVDSSGNGNTLSAVCGLDNANLMRSSRVPSGYTGASRWYGSNTYLIASSYTMLNITGNLSLSAWVYVTTTPTSGVQQPIVTKNLTTGSNRQYRLRIFGTGSSQFRFNGAVSHNGSAVDSVFSAGTIYDDSTWYHVVFVSDGTDLRIYVNGILDCEPVVHTTGIASKLGRFAIGTQDGASAWFRGNIDEVGVFSRALTAAEVQEIYWWGLKDNGLFDYPLYTEFSATDGSRPSDANLYQYLKDSLSALCNAVAVSGDTTWTYTVWDTSAQGRDLMGVKIVPGNYTKTILIDAGIHGNNGETTTSFGTLQLLKWLADTTYPRIRWIVILQTNPDGAILSQRKNNNTTAINEPTPRSVNLNRNFDFRRNLLTSSTYIDPASSEYYGPYAISEPESKMLRNVLLQYLSEIDLYVNLHTNTNAIIATTSAKATKSQIPNSFLENNGLEPYVKATTFANWPFLGGSPVQWSDSMGLKQGETIEYSLCYTTTQTKEEINRSIAYFKAYADYLSWIPKIDSIETALCSLSVILHWTENTGTDSVRIIRDGSRIAAVAGGVLTYADTVADFDTYTYSLLAFYSSGQVSDTSNYYDVTLTCADYTIQRGGWQDGWGGSWGDGWE